MGKPIKRISHPVIKGSFRLATYGKNYICNKRKTTGKDEGSIHVFIYYEYYFHFH